MPDGPTPSNAALSMPSTGEKSGSFETALAVLIERVARIEQARQIQGTETERRLGELNGEGARIRSILAESVSREKFEQYVSAQSEALTLALTTITDKLDVGLRQVQERVDTAAATQRERSDNNSSRLDRIETAATAVASRVVEQRLNTNQIIAIVTLLVFVIATAAAIIATRH